MKTILTVFSTIFFAIAALATDIVPNPASPGNIGQPGGAFPGGYFTNLYAVTSITLNGVQITSWPSGGSDTPWTINHNANGYDLTGAGTVAGSIVTAGGTNLLGLIITGTNALRVYGAAQLLDATNKIQTWASATFLTGNQTITASGDATGSGTTTLALTLATVNASPGTYRSLTVNAKGLATGGSNPTTFSGYGLSDTWANLVSSLSGSLSGTVLTAASVPDSALASTFLKANQTISISGDASGSGTTAITLTLATVASAGTSTKVTYNAKGQVTSGTTLSLSDLPTGYANGGAAASATNGTTVSAGANTTVTASVNVNGTTDYSVASSPTNNPTFTGTALFTGGINQTNPATTNVLKGFTSLNGGVSGDSATFTGTTIAYSQTNNVVGITNQMNPNYSIWRFTNNVTRTYVQAPTNALGGQEFYLVNLAPTNLLIVTNISGLPISNSYQILGALGSGSNALAIVNGEGSLTNGF